MFLHDHNTLSVPHDSRLKSSEAEAHFYKVFNGNLDWEAKTFCTSRAHHQIHGCRITHPVSTHCPFPWFWITVSGFSSFLVLSGLSLLFSNTSYLLLPPCHTRTHHSLLVSVFAYVWVLIFNLGCHLSQFILQRLTTGAVPPVNLPQDHSGTMVCLFCAVSITGFAILLEDPYVPVPSTVLWPNEQELSSILLWSPKSDIVPVTKNALPFLKFQSTMCYLHSH